MTQVSVIITQPPCGRPVSPVTCGWGGKYVITVRPGMLSGHLKSDFISRNISHRLPPVWKYFTKIIPCHQKYVSWLAGCGVLNNVKWNKFRGYKVSPGCQFTISHASLAPGLDLDWVVVILCNNFPAQPQIWPQWTHYPLIHNFHPLLPSPLPGQPSQHRFRC